MKHLFLFTLGTFFSLSLAAQEGSWLTYYEQSGFKQTPRYAETIDFCKKLDAASPWISYQSFGKSAQGRDLPLLILDTHGNFTPDAMRVGRNAVILIQACIHPGESEGKDAGLMLFRDIAVNKKLVEHLDHVTLLFIPIYNVDGHERFGPYNRINQNGPEEMGWRTTATNLNLNRDYLKADAPETRAWLDLFNQWRPDFFIDCHTTDGADYQYTVTYALETHGNMDKGLTQWQLETLEPFLKNEMEKAGFQIFPYVWFRNWHDPASGLSAGVSPPMLSQGYTALRNCPGLLIETHMLKPYRPRVASTYEMIRLCVEMVDRDRETLIQLIKQADAFCASEAFRKEPYPLDFMANPNDSVMVDFLGVEYDSKISDLTGGPWVTYYKEKPKNLHIPFFNKIEPSAKADLPVAYIIPTEWTDVINLMKDHDIEMTFLAEETTIPATMFRLNGPKWQEQPYEGRHIMSQIEGKTAIEDIRFPAGSAIVSMSQRSARLIPYFLEPSADGSLLSWGFFDAVMEQKEYAESYVMEVMAREMIREKPELLQELEEKKKGDPEFAKNPRNSINWFYMKSPYWDQKKNLYPVGKIMDPGVIKRLRLR